MDEREPVLKVPRPGEVYRQREPPHHPAIVVSTERFNKGCYVVAVIVTSQRFDERSVLPSCVPFLSGQFGFDRNCVAQAESISQLEIHELELSDGPMGCLSDEKFRDLVRAIGNVVGAVCEPL